MAVSTDMLRAWRHPRALIREKLGQGPREDRALALLMAACGLLFVAQWPVHARAAYLDPTTPLEARLGGALLGSLFLLPLLAYAVAGLSHLAARAVGGKGQGFGARLAFFWALLAVAPVALLQGLVAGMIGPSPGLIAVQLLAGGGFLWIWLSMLVEAERG
ncbi:YIP1 family protein [Tabrizicola fusiformis]|uniref:YIP1 family protein n=1 Tax=Tabrizicola sp. SY72 TaxID=2741673 RepID=UPI0015735848|nr:YIP1 family protein [Tabrizicola sp. SY72]NTT87495.1 YIP1 family protein [Tabrizicola sp. SY72]